jgi:SAM-dependent methyltransferase
MSPVTQTWDPKSYAHNAGFVAELGEGAMQVLAAQPGERVLDLGCGDGVLTEQLARAGCMVVGVDASAPQIEAARARGLQAFVMSGEALSYDNEFDAVFSNAALHWMPDADAVIRGVHRALVPGGRFVAELGGHGNVARIRAALAEALTRRGIEVVSPWYFPSIEEYAEKLTAAGFSVRSIELFDRPTPLPTGIEGWLATFAQSQLAGLGESDAAAVLKDVVALLEPQLHGPNGWLADYVRLRFAADKPA